MNALLAIALHLGAAFAFTAMSALIRWVSERVPLGEVVFARSFFALIPLLIMLAQWGELSDAFRARNPLGQVWRGLTGAAAMFAVFAGLERLPLADATAIGFAAPLITVALAALVLGETVRVYRWSAVVVGFVGVLVMLVPLFGRRTGGTDDFTGGLFALAGAFLTALSMVQVRRLTASESTASIVFYFSAVAAATGLLTLPWGWVWPGGVDALVLVSIGVLGGIGQIMLTQSYRLADASVVAPFGYSAMLWSMAIGFVAFGERAEPIVLSGAAVVIAAGLFVIWRERQLGLDRTVTKEAATPPAAPPGG